MPLAHKAKAKSTYSHLSEIQVVGRTLVAWWFKLVSLVSDRFYAYPLVFLPVMSMLTKGQPSAICSQCYCYQLGHMI
jgi:hypothetical protein